MYYLITYINIYILINNNQFGKNRYFKSNNNSNINEVDCNKRKIKKIYTLCLLLIHLESTSRFYINFKKKK